MNNEEKSSNPNWLEYYKNKSNLVPRETLVKALNLFNEENRKNLSAIDVGCGHGSDTIELLKNGWKVLAIDNEESGLQILKETINTEWKDNLILRKQSFEEMKFTICDLLNASYSLPFCNPEYFPTLWGKIEDSININGRFAGNFFGTNDSWSGNKSMTFHKKEEVRHMFRNFEVTIFEERDEDGKTATGQEKHWHTFSVIAKKIKK